jgi:hypothetical protein
MSQYQSKNNMHRYITAGVHARVRARMGKTNDDQKKDTHQAVAMMPGKQVLSPRTQQRNIKMPQGECAAPCIINLVKPNKHREGKKEIKKGR